MERTANEVKYSTGGRHHPSPLILHRTSIIHYIYTLFRTPLEGGLTMSLSRRQRGIVLAAAFLAWTFGGLEMGITTLVMRPAVRDLLGETAAIESDVQQWLAWYTAAFLIGAATGGFVFGSLGDRRGRVSGLGWAVMCYAVFAGAAYYVSTTHDLLALRFLSCMGIGGVWPNAVALVAEAWPNVSRPTLAGVLGTGANLGLVLLGVLCLRHHVTPDDWRWTMLVGAAPCVLGVWILLAVPESPAWLTKRLEPTAASADQGAPVGPSVFRPPYLRITLVGILLGMIPTLGNWGSVNWLMPWADQAGSTLAGDAKAWAQIARSGGGAVGSLLGGWAASLLGRRRSYFMISLASLGVSQYVFAFLTPQDESFMLWALALGFVSTIYFGWLPLYLPELFPVAVRSTGTGVSFNFGRYLSAVGVLATGAIAGAYSLDYARLGQITSLVFALGMVIIWLAPDTSRRSLAD
jgi:MFS family permease